MVHRGATDSRPALSLVLGHRQGPPCIIEHVSLGASIENDVFRSRSKSRIVNWSQIPASSGSVFLAACCPRSQELRWKQSSFCLRLSWGTAHVAGRSWLSATIDHCGAWPLSCGTACLSRRLSPVTQAPARPFGRRNAEAANWRRICGGRRAAGLTGVG